MTEQWETPEEKEGAEEQQTDEETQETTPAPAEEDTQEEPEDDGLEDEDREYSERVQKRIAQKTRQQREAEREAQKERERADRLEREIQRLSHERESSKGPSREVPPEQKAPTGPPKEADFESWDEYQEALVDYKIEQKLVRDRQQQEARSKHDRYNKSMDDAARKYEDFADKVYRNPAQGGAPISDAMYYATLECPEPGEVAYYFANHHDEAARIFRLSQEQAAIEVFKVAAKLDAGAASNAPLRVSNAPEPIEQKVGSANKGGKLNPDDLSIEEWMEKSRKGELKYR